MKFPDFKIGDSVQLPAFLSRSQPEALGSAPRDPAPEAGKKSPLRFSSAKLFKVIGKDKKIYGPVSGAEIEQWLAEGRILATSLAQKVGYQEWKQLLHFAETHLP